MVIREFGKEREETLLFFPGSCEPWQEFAPAAKALAQAFRNPGRLTDMIRKIIPTSYP